MSHKHKHKHKAVQPKMTTLQDLEALYTAGDAPVNPVNGFKKPSKPNSSWKFYESVRNHLPEWWEEFNGELDHHGRLKYDTIRQFIKTKTRKREEQTFLIQMLGPASKHETEVPWLGDWERRRNNGFGVLSNPEVLKPLIKTIQNNMAAAESIKSLTPILVEELVQYSALQKQVHQAFAGRAFAGGRADDKRNVGRFDVYKKMLWALTELKIKIVAEIMRCHGVDPNTPQQMREMAQIAGGIGAAAALTGIAAGQISGVRSSDGSMVAPYTYDAIKLAEHLTRNAHTFKKPLPVLDGEGMLHEDPSSSASKANGKPQ